MTWKLLASAPTLDAIAECIARFYGGERKHMEAVNDGWRLHRSNGYAIEGVRVIAKRGRYRFEMQA